MVVTQLGEQFSNVCTLCVLCSCSTYCIMILIAWSVTIAYTQLIIQTTYYEKVMEDRDMTEKRSGILTVECTIDSYDR